MTISVILVDVVIIKIKILTFNTKKNSPNNWI